MKPVSAFLGKTGSHLYGELDALDRVLGFPWLCHCLFPETAAAAFSSTASTYAGNKEARSLLRLDKRVTDHGRIQVPEV